MPPQDPLTQAYEEYARQLIEVPVERERARALQRIGEEMAMRGLVRAGLGLYPITEAERQYADILARERARLGLARAEREIALQEAQRQREFQRQMLERQYEMQREIMEQQRRMMEEQAWRELFGGLIGMGIGLVAPPLIGWGLGQLGIPTVSPLEQALTTYYQQLIGQLTPTTGVSPVRTPVTAGVPLPTGIPVTATGIPFVEPPLFPGEAERIRMGR